MKTIFIYTALTTCIYLQSCTHSSESGGILEPEQLKSSNVELQLNDSYELMKANCYVCHNPNTASHDDLLAPPFAAVKWRYLRQYPEKEAFVKAMSDWVKSPAPDKVLMRGAVNEFKIMPPLPLDTEVLKKISTYIYENEVEQPEWFEEHFNQMHGQGMKN